MSRVVATAMESTTMSKLRFLLSALAVSIGVWVVEPFLNVDDGFAPFETFEF